MVDRLLNRGPRGDHDQPRDAASSGQGSPAAAATPDPNAEVWSRVQLARNLKRPHALELIRIMADEFVELHGDRFFADDEAIVAGFARIDGRRVVVVGQQKGAEVEENIRRNFGMPHPEGYRKAMRIMELAERFGLPIVTFVDTPGAFPGAGSEERGVAEAIARSIGLMARLRTPIVTVITGEGGSGGALAIAVGDVVVAFENAVYAVISPEGCASILWRSADAAAQAAAAMRMTAAEQQALGVVDFVVEEPGEGAHTDPVEAARRLRSVIVAQLDALGRLSLEELLEARYRRYRAFGAFTVEETPVSAQPAERQGLTDRLRGLLDAGRQTLGGSLPGPRRDEPPAREEV